MAKHSFENLQVTTSISLPFALLKRVKEKCKRDMIPFSAYVRRLILEDLGNEQELNDQGD